MDLANRIGCTVAEAKRRVSWAEFIDWRAYSAIEDERKQKPDHMAYHFAHLCWLITALYQGSEKAGDIQDHLLDFSPAPEISPEEQANAVAIKLKFALGALPQVKK